MRRICLVLLALLCFIPMAGAQEERTISVIFVKKGPTVPEAARSALVGPLTGFFRGREGFRLADPDGLDRYAKPEGVKYFSDDYFNGLAGFLGRDLLLTAYLDAQPAVTPGSLSYKGRLYYYDRAVGGVAFSSTFACDDCVAEQFQAVAAREVSTFLAGPYLFVLTTTPGGAEVVEGDTPLGTTPARLRFAAGKHTIRIEKEGYKRLAIDFAMPNDRNLAASLTLTEKPADEPALVALPVPDDAPPAAVRPAAPKVDDRPSGGSVVKADRPSGPVDKRPIRRRAGLGLLGLAVASGVTGAALMIEGFDLDDAAGRALLPERGDALRSSSDKHLYGAYAAYGLAGAALVAGVTLLILDAGGGGGPSFTMAPAVGPDGAGLTAAFRY